ncbi:MAG: PD-(D/E)XK nuclease family protein [Thermoleophilia bacterium]
MALKLICGPTGSGKTTRAIETFLEALARGERALFIAPSMPDARHFERQIIRRLGKSGPVEGAGGSGSRQDSSGVLTGGRVTTFDGLFAEIRRNAGAAKTVISEVERNLLIRAVIDGTSDLSITKESSSYSGFVRALGNLITELQEADIEPIAFAEAGNGIMSHKLNNDILWLYKGYLDAIREHSSIDGEGARRQALELLDSNRGVIDYRTVVIDGFWDFTLREHGIIQRLQKICEVLLTLPYEEGRIALKAPGRQFSELVKEASGVERLPARVESNRPPALSALDVHLFEESRHVSSAQGAVSLIEGTGRRGQAELIAAEVLDLYRSRQTELDRIAVVCRHLGPDATAIASALDELGIPYDFQGMLPLPESSLGQTALAALDFTDALLGFNTNPAESLFRFLRSALPVADEGIVDKFARKVGFYGINNAADLLRTWKDCGGQDLEMLTDLAAEALKGSAGLGASLCRGLKDLVAATLMGSIQPDRSRESVADKTTETDLRSLYALDGVCREAAAVESLKHFTGREATALLRDGIKTASSPMGSGDKRGCVRLLDPHRILNQRFDVVFICGLLEKQFPLSFREDPFLSKRIRQRLINEHKLSLQTGNEDENLEDERFLFHRTITRSDKKVYLCYPRSDVDGKQTVPSLFVEDVLEIFRKDGHPPVKRQRVSDLTFATQEAPNVAQALQSLCLEAGKNTAKGGKCPERTTTLLLAAAAPAGIDDELRRCLAAILPPPFILGEEARAEFASRDLFSASALETYTGCNYRYFVEKVISPASMDSDTYFFDRGLIAHCVISQLGRALKRAGVVLWRAEKGQIRMAHDLIEQFLNDVAVEKGLEKDLNGMVLTATLRFYLHRFIDDQTRLESDLEPSLFEFPFGGLTVDEDCGGLNSTEDALLIGGRFRLQGKIDRIDVKPETAKALIIDYKTSLSSVSSWSKWEDQGELQIQIYMLAAMRLMGFEPVGCEYLSLSEGKRKAMYLEDEAELIGPAKVSRHNKVTAGQMNEVLEKAEAMAAAAAEGIGAADFARRASDGRTCKRCDYAAVCRGALQ